MMMLALFVLFVGSVRCSPDCAKIGTRKPMKITPDNKYGLWPGLASEVDLKYGESLYGVEAAIERIWKNQHPPDCSKAKYLLSGEWHAGFGSEHYYHGIGLGLAVESGRVFIHEGGHPWRYENPFCEKQGKISMLCYLLPYSNCTMDDAFKTIHKSYPKYNVPKASVQQYGTITAKSGEKITLQRINSGHTRYPNESFHFDSPHANDNVIMMTDHMITSHHYDAVPSVMSDLISCANITKGTEYLWWRSIALAYQLRPNPVVLKLIDEIREKTVQQAEGRCVSTFVRHGDKYKEMKLQPFSTYADVAEKLFTKMDEFYAAHPDVNKYQGDKTAPKLFYLNSEDFAVFEEAKRWGAAKKIEVLYSNLSQTIHREKDPSKDEKHPMEYFSYFLHLVDTMSCMYHVCTQASNSCRVIDNLRATLGGKANRYNVDLSPESCKEPPCYREYALGNFQGELYNPRNIVWRD